MPEPAPEPEVPAAETKSEDEIPQTLSTEKDEL